MIINPFIKARTKPQHLSWKHLLEKTSYQLELLLPFSAVIMEWGRTGAYLSLCAEVLVTKKTTNSEIIAGQKIIIDVPVKTFERSWQGINYELRKSVDENSNVKITITKNSRKDMILTNCEKKEVTPDQREFCEKNYSELQQEYTAIVRKEETL